MSLVDSEEEFQSSFVKKIKKKSLNTNGSGHDNTMTTASSSNNNNISHGNNLPTSGSGNSSSAQHDDNTASSSQHHSNGKEQVVTSEPEHASPNAAPPPEEDDGEPRVVEDPVQKQIFDEQREQIMGIVPDSVKGRFGEIVYSTFGSYIGPVLILNPYHVSPGPVRDQWFRMYEKCKASERLQNMTHLCYWYGTYDNLDNAYSFLPSNKLVPFESGRKRVQTKLEGLMRKSRLKSTDELLQKGVLEMEEDLPKDPQDRAGNIGRDFLEVYEHIIEPGQEYVPDPNHVVLAATTPDKPKKKKSGKRKHGDTEEEAAGDEAVKPKKKKKKKKPKMETVVEEETEVAESSLPLKKRKKKKKLEAMDQGEAADGSSQQEQVPPQPEERRMSAYDEYMLAMAEERSHGDTDDEDVDLGGVESDDDVAVENLKLLADDRPDEEEEVKVGRPKDRKKRVKEPPKKKGTKAKQKMEKRPKGEKKAPTEDAKRKAEQRRFEACEQNYAPLIRRWKKALSNKDGDQISRIYGQLLEVVEKFTAPFIKVYELSALMKESKKIVNNEKRKELLGKLKEQYTTKSQDVPAGFVPEKASDEPAAKSTAAKSEQKPQRKEATPKKNLMRKSMSDRDLKPSKLEYNDEAPPSQSTEQAASQESNPKVPAMAKMERKKKFSLGGFVRPSSVPPPEETDAAQDRPADMSATAPQSKTPIWMSQASADSLQVTDNSRLLALEFLKQAAPFVPLSKGVNHDAIARSLEVAIFSWASSTDGQNGVANLDSANADKYWNKLHSLVAGISGKRTPGTLAKLIGEGKFAAAADLVNLSDDILYTSFQGKPLSGF